MTTTTTITTTTTKIRQVKTTTRLTTTTQWKSPPCPVNFLDINPDEEEYATGSCLQILDNDSNITMFARENT